MLTALQRQDGFALELCCSSRLQPTESNMLVVLPVVDYDAQRALAAANVAAEVQTVRSLVNKFGKAQRAAEETLEMCDGRVEACSRSASCQCGLDECRYRRRCATK